jgi:hypothetical protein
MKTERQLSRVRLVLIATLLLTATATAARGQTPQMTWGLHGGTVLPVFSFGDYFELGANAGLDVGYALQDRIDLKADLDFDLINRHKFFPTPIMRLWRYRLGLEADVLPDAGDSRVLLKAGLGVGATTVRSGEFWVESRPTIDGERIRQTSLTGTGGLRLGFRTGSGLVWWLGGKLNWSPIADDDADTLREAARRTLDAPSAATSVAITLGFNLNR